jgi:hypothetical protein
MSLADIAIDFEMQRFPGQGRRRRRRQLCRDVAAKASGAEQRGRSPARQATKRTAAREILLDRVPQAVETLTFDGDVLLRVCDKSRNANAKAPGPKTSRQ